MTCDGYKTNIEYTLNNIPKINNVIANLDTNELLIEMSSHISVKELHDNTDVHHDNDGNKSMGENRDIDCSEENNASTNLIVEAYLQIKNALVEGNKTGAAKGGESLLLAFSAFDMSRAQEQEKRTIWNRTSGIYGFSREYH